MTTVAEQVAVHVSIRLETGDEQSLPSCRDIPVAEYGDTFYTNPPRPLSIAQLPDTGLEYEMRSCSRVVRQNARVAARRGYRYERIDRADWETDLHAIRSSSAERQGRRMPLAYMERQAYASDVWPEPYCLRHLVTVHGVIGPDGHLAAYAQVVQCGEIVRFNTIMGHWDRLDDRVVWLLMLELIRWHIDVCDARYALYYEHDSGAGGGLRYMKERFGFRPSVVTWIP